MFFEKFESSAVKSIEVDDNIVTIVFNSSDKEYKYNIIDEEFTNTLEDAIINNKSIGSLINKSIKDKLIVELNTKSVLSCGQASSFQRRFNHQCSPRNPCNNSISSKKMMF